MDVDEFNDIEIAEMEFDTQQMDFNDDCNI